MPVVVIRWHSVLSKNFLPARYVKLAAVHGAFDVSTTTLITPRFVVIVIVSKPDRGSPEAGGVPTFLISDGSGCGDGEALGSTSGSHSHAVGVAEPEAEGLALFFFPPVSAIRIQATATSTARTSTPPATAVRLRRRRAAVSARSVISRSSLARAA